MLLKIFNYCLSILKDQITIYDELGSHKLGVMTLTPLFLVIMEKIYDHFLLVSNSFLSKIVNKIYFSANTMVGHFEDRQPKSSWAQ